MRMGLQGPETVMELPLLPGEPEDVVFNDLEGVLAEVSTESWSGPKPREGR